jgi:hypothetical protein
MRLVKWFFGILGYTLVVVASVVLGVGLWVYFYPGDAWHFAERHILPKDLKISWQSLDVDLDMVGWKSWELKWNVQRLNVQKGAPRVNAPLEEVSGAVGISLKPFQFTVHDFIIKGDQKIQFYSSPSAQPAPEQNYYEMMKTALNYLNKAKRMAYVEQVHVDVARFEYFAEKNPVPIVAALKMAKAPRPEENIDFTVKVSKVTKDIDTVDLSGQIEMAKFNPSDKETGARMQPFLNALMNISGARLKVKVPLEFAYYNERGELRSNTSIRFQTEKRLLVADPKIQAKMGPDEIDLRIETPVTGIPGPVARIANMVATFRIPLQSGEEWSPKPTDFKISAPIALYFIDANMRKPFEKSCQCLIPEKLMADLEGKVWLRSILDAKARSKPILDARVGLQSVKNKLLSMSLGGNLKIRRDEKREMIYEPVLDSELTIHSYQGIRQFLDAKNVLIPAPFDVLEGTLHLRAKGPIGITYTDGKPAQLNAEAKLDVDLSSRKQKVLFSTVALVQTNSEFKRVDVNVKSSIERLQLELPPFDPIRGVPKAVRDHRILVGSKPVKKPGIQIVINVEVETTQPDAIKLYSKLADPYVPINVRIKKQDQNNPAGRIEISPFKVVYLRRTLHVDSVKLNLAQTPNKDYPIQGDFHVKQTEYTIFIHVGGTTANPQIHLSSDPYLERTDIISVLLYDRVSSQLVGGDSETVGNVQAAMADRAIGLFGLWAFAATPIRSFSYNVFRDGFTGRWVDGWHWHKLGSKYQS